MHRPTRLLCPSCDYDLSGGMPRELRCPECGRSLRGLASAVPWANAPPSVPPTSRIFRLTLRTLVLLWLIATGLAFAAFTPPVLVGGQATAPANALTPLSMLLNFGLSAVPLLTAIVWDSCRRRVVLMHWSMQFIWSTIAQAVGVLSAWTIFQISLA